MNTQTIGLAAAASAAALGGALTPAAAQSAPDIVFGIEDTDQNGTADGFSSSGLADAVTDRFTERRTFSEFSLASVTGAVDIALFEGTIDESFSFGFGPTPAELAFEVYAANGASDLTDWDASGVSIGSVTLADDFDSQAFSFDASTAVQDLIDGGATHAGLRVRTLTSGIGQVDVLDTTLSVSVIPAPGALVLMGISGLAAARRRR